MPTQKRTAAARKTQRRSKTTTKPARIIAETSLDHALRYAKEGIRVIWIPRGTKAPVAKGWPALATTDAEKIRQWAVEHPGCNFGLVMGGGILAVDVDDPAVLPDLSERGLLVQTREHSTPSGGSHFLFRVPEDAVIKNAVRILDGVDIRSAGGQIVGPGSVHPNGGMYAVEDDSAIADAPAALLELLTAKPAPKASANDDVPEGQRNVFLFKLGCKLRNKGLSEDEIIAALLERNAGFTVPLPVSEVEATGRSSARYDVPTGVQSLRDSGLPWVQLTGDNRLVSALAADLGTHLCGKAYRRGDEVVVLGEDGKQTRLGVQSFRTWLERHVVPYRQKLADKVLVKVGVTASEAESRGVLASEHFKGQLQPLQRVNNARLPVLRKNGIIELLPIGYDAEAETFTVGGVSYQMNMALDDARAVLDEYLGEFEFADGERSKSVSIFALVGMGAAGLLPKGSLRPAYVTTKNAPGAGASTLTACIVTPFCGSMTTTAMPNEDDEMRKTLLTAVRDGKDYIVFDNIKSRIGGPSIEAFISAPTFGGRLLGVNESAEYPNNVTTFFTSNGSTVSSDMRRRSLFIELHLSVERAEDRTFKRSLSAPALAAWTPRILAAVWSLIRHWDAAGRLSASRSHSAFREFAEVVGGIVEAAGYASPLETAKVAEEADEDAASMRLLVDAMQAGRKYTSAQLADVCRVVEAFNGLVAENENAMSRSQRSGFGKVIARYHDRQVGDRKFYIEGAGHARRFSVSEVIPSLHGRMVEHGPAPRTRAC